MKALITGAGGFVGPHLRAELLAHGDQVIAVDRHDGPDLLCPNDWRQLVAHERPDVVYHLAGWSDVGASWQHPHDTFALNIMGTAAVLEASAQADVQRCVVISSADVYGVVTPTDLPLRETRTPAPRSPYGASKRCTEDLAMSYWLGRGLPTIIVRPFNHFGPGQSARFAVPAFAQQIAEAEQGGHPELRHGDLSAQRDFTDVRDVVAAYRRLATDGEPGEIYNVCTGRAVAMQAILDQLLALALVPIRSEVDPTRLRPIELPVLQGSMEKIHTTVGWEPRYDLPQTLQDVLNDARRAVGQQHPVSPPAS